MRYLILALAFLAASSVWASPITRNDIRVSTVQTIVLTASTAMSLSSSVGTTDRQVVFLEFHSQNATTSVVGYSEGTSPAAVSPVKEDETYYARPVRGNAHIICSTCVSQATAVTVTVRTY